MRPTRTLTRALTSLAALAAACDRPPLADPTGGGAAAAPEADGPLILAAASEADGPFLTIIPDGPRPGPMFLRPGTGHPPWPTKASRTSPARTSRTAATSATSTASTYAAARSSTMAAKTNFKCWEGSCTGSGSGGREVGGDDGWWHDIWELISCGGARGRLAAEYGVWGRLLCYAFWLHGPEWIVPDGDIEYGEVHGEWGLMFWQMQNLVRKMEAHCGIKALVTSGYRCPVGNGGTPDAKPKSQHTVGSA